MSSLYAQYIKAREGIDIVEWADGFATYKIQEDSIYLRDLFVESRSRSRGIAARLADHVCAIGKKAGCKKLIGSVCPQAADATENMKALLHYGMSLNSASPSLIIFEKEL